MAPDFELLSEARWLDFWEHYEGLPHQKESVLRLRKGILGAQPGLLATTAGWAKDFTPAVKPAATKPPAGVKQRAITYFRQTDSRNPADRGGMCFSSTAAMFATYYRPGLFLPPNGDDEYLKLLRQHGGDTTVMADQLAQLKRLGLNAKGTTEGDWALLERVCRAGGVAMAGWLHHGTPASPTGGGHWSLVGGITDKAVQMWDPNGEADLVNGGYLANLDGAGLWYSRKNWGPRWMAEGAGSGWAITL
jgi:hypothetical protein